MRRQRCNVRVAEQVVIRRHAVWTRVATGGGREAAFDNDRNHVGRVGHQHRAIAGQRGERIRFALAIFAVTVGAVFRVKRHAYAVAFVLRDELAGCAGGTRWLDRRQRLQVRRHRQ